MVNQIGILDIPQEILNRLIININMNLNWFILPIQHWNIIYFIIKLFLYRVSDSKTFSSINNQILWVQFYLKDEDPKKFLEFLNVETLP